MLLEITEDPLDGLQIGGVRRQADVVHPVRLHERVPIVVMDACIVVQDNTGIRLHVSSQPRHIRPHLGVETL